MRKGVMSLGLLSCLVLLSFVLSFAGADEFGVFDVPSTLNVAITYPSDTLWYNSVLSKFNFSITSNYALDTCAYYINGSTKLDFACNVSWIPYSFGQGIYNIKIEANDSSGAYKPHNIKFYVDLVNPLVTINETTIYTKNPTFINAATSDNMDPNGVSHSWTWINHSSSNSLNLSNPSDQDTNVQVTGDGNFTLTLTATDEAGNTGSDSLNFIWDTTGPNITLIGANPQNISYGDSYVELNATISDEFDVAPHLDIDSSALNVSKLGTYTITYSGYDSLGNLAANVSRTVNVLDNVAPELTLLGNNTQYIELNTSYVELSAVANDNYDGNRTSEIIINSSGVDVNVINSYNVSYFVNDSSGNINISLREVIVRDTTSPSITNVLPSSDIPYDIGEIINFEFNVSDLSPISNCSLILDGVVNQTNLSVDSTLSQIFSVSGFSSGEHSWKLSCTDVYNNDNEQSISLRYFTFLSDVSFVNNFTEYTNLSLETNISNVLYFFVRNDYGMINFSSPLDLSSGIDFSQYINISNNYIFVNSSAAPELNQSAYIIFNNVSFSNPQLMKNGDVASSSDYSSLSYNSTSGVLSVYVSGFSYYYVRETPVSSGSSGGGGGGGGGGSCSDRTWSCGSFGSCLDGEQERTCTSNCNRVKTETQSCFGTQSSFFGKLLENSDEEEKPSYTLYDSNYQTGQDGSSGYFGITGGAIGIGDVTTQAAGAIIFIFLLAWVYFLIRHHRKPKEHQYVIRKIDDMLKEDKYKVKTK